MTIKAKCLRYADGPAIFPEVKKVMKIVVKRKKANMPTIKYSTAFPYLISVEGSAILIIIVAITKVKCGGYCGGGYLLVGGFQ
jgi:hypothetical protein